MSRQETNIILRCTNKPSKILFWDLDESLAFMIPFCLMLFVDAFVLGVVIGVVCCLILKWLKRHFGDSALVLIMYWYMPTPKRRFKFYLPSHIREYIG